MTGLLGNSTMRPTQRAFKRPRRAGESIFGDNGEGTIYGDPSQYKSTRQTMREIEPPRGPDAAMEFDSAGEPLPDIMEDSGNALAMARQMRDRVLAEIARQADAQYQTDYAEQTPEM